MSYEVIKATSINGELERVPTGTLKNTDSASARVHKGGGGHKVRNIFTTKTTKLKTLSMRIASLIGFQHR